MINPFGTANHIAGSFDLSLDLCWVSYWPTAEPTQISLDGNFTLDELKAFVALMEGVVAK